MTTAAASARRLNALAAYQSASERLDSIEDRFGPNSAEFKEARKESAIAAGRFRTADIEAR